MNGHYWAYGLWQLSYPLVQAASDPGRREAFLGELQVLFPTIEHSLVDGRPQLHLCTPLAVTIL